VLIVTSQMRSIVAVAPEDERAVVEPGVINLQVTKAASPHGYYYAPDPSSQQICSIGGNVAENSGGAHCLKYGFTTNHVTGAEIVAPDGELVRLGGRAPDAPGYDLLGAFVGSEGTLGIATEVTVRLVRLPEAVRTLLAAFGSTDLAGAATSAIIAAGVVPAAVEMMDALAIEAAEAAVACGYPDGAGAVLIVELDGPAAEVAAPVRRGRTPLPGGRRVRDPDRRRRRRGGRCSGRAASRAFAAVGRISPDYIVQDGVIPRTALPEVLRRIGEVSAEHGVRVANVFPRRGRQPASAGAVRRRRRRGGRAGRGGLRCHHRPLHRVRRVDHRRARCRHGQAKYMPRMFSDDDLDTMQLVRCAFDPDGLANPGKIFPTPRLCGEVPGRHKGRPSVAGGRRRGGLLMADTLDLARPAGDGDTVGGVPARQVAAPASTEEAAALLREAADRDLAVVIRGGGTTLDWGNPPERLDLIVDTRRLAGVVEHAAGDLITVVRAGTPMADLKLAGQQLALDVPYPGATSAARSRPTPAGRGGCSTAPPATC
jgi:glycolate oxidase